MSWKAFCLTHAAVFSVSRGTRSLTHPLFIQLQQGVPDLGGVWGQAKTVQVQLRHDELQQPLGRQAPRGRVTSGRRHWLLQDGPSQRLHLRGRFTFITPGRINFTHTELEESFEGREVAVYLCGAKDDSVIVLSSAGSFFLLSTETDGHWTEAIVHAEEILVFCDDNTETHKYNCEEQSWKCCTWSKNCDRVGVKIWRS